MGARGFTSNPNALEGHSGYFEDFGRGLEVSLDPFKDLGSRYDLVTMGYDLKAYPCGGLAHTAIEAALALRERLAPRLVRHHQHPLLGHPQCRPARRHPISAVDRERQVQPGLYGGLFAGARRADDLGVHRGGDPRRAGEGGGQDGVGDRRSGLGPGTRESPAILKVTLSDGQTFEQRVDFQTGSIKNPMTQAQIENKFRDCAAQSVQPDVAGKIIAVLNELPGRRIVRGFLAADPVELVDIRRLRPSS